MDEKKHLQDLIKQKYEEIKQRNHSFLDTEDLEKEIEILEQKITKIDMQNWKFIDSDNEIDLYKPVPGLEGPYFIYLAGTQVEVGHITYRPNEFESIFGDVSYDIEEEYVGHNYAFKALCIFLEYLKKEDIKNIRISVNDNNVASLKVQEKMMSLENSVQTSHNDEYGITIFDYELRKNKKVSNRH